MPDITMCKGKDCPLKKDCWRYRAVPGEMQSYFTEPPYNKQDKNCKFFWSVEDHREP